ncbi:hypothetical protein HMPREF2844_02755 [Neisseria sp. HMSC072F04]|jgi:hypothetical protein|nr:hypothetical protein HMPREF2844_02755 [Neisseria sp. HMSC072F04]
MNFHNILFYMVFWLARLHCAVNLFPLPLQVEVFTVCWIGLFTNQWGLFTYLVVIENNLFRVSVKTREFPLYFN